jgi:hypothetical protein
VAAVLVCLKQSITINYRANPALVKLESKRAQHAISGLLYSVTKVKKEAKGKTVVPTQEMI